MGPLPGMVAGPSRFAAGAPGGPDGPRQAAGGRSVTATWPTC